MDHAAIEKALSIILPSVVGMVALVIFTVIHRDTINHKMNKFAGYLIDLFEIYKKKYVIRKTGRFRIERELVDNQHAFFIEKKHKLGGWKRIYVTKTIHKNGKVNKTETMLWLDTERKALAEIDNIISRKPSIVEFVYQGNQLDRIVRELRPL